MAAILEEWCQITVFHGIKDLYESKKIILKCVWFVIVTTGFFFAGNQITEVVLRFLLDEKWETKVSTEVPDRLFLPWPNMTICNPNLLFTSKLSDMGLQDPREIAFLSSPGLDGLKFYDQFLFTEGQEISNHTWNRTDAAKKNVSLRFF